MIRRLGLDVVIRNTGIAAVLGRPLVPAVPGSVWLWLAAGVHADGCEVAADLEHVVKPRDGLRTVLANRAETARSGDVQLVGMPVSNKIAAHLVDISM